MPPNGVPLTTALAPSQALLHHLNYVLQAVDSVHGDGNLQFTVPVTWGAQGSTLGLYTPGNPPKIMIKQEQRQPGLTLLHELGHLLDNAVIEPGQSWRSTAGDARLAPVLAAIEATQLHQHFAKLSCGKVMRVPRVSGHGKEQIKIDQRIVTDRLDPRELFARAYAQYVVERSGDQTLVAQLNSARAGRAAMLYPEHWTDEDFAPVSRAIDELMHQLSWRTP